MTKKSKREHADPELNLLTKKGEIRGDMAIAEVVGHYPETMPVFFKHGMTCFGCPMALQETVEQGAEVHGIDPTEMIKELNESLSKSKKNVSKKR